MTDVVYQLVSTIRYDPFILDLPWNSAVNYAQPSPFMLLPYHFDRLRSAAAMHEWQDTFASISWTLFQVTCRCAIQAYDGPAKGGPLKLRLALNRAGTFTTTVIPSSPLTADPILAAHISPSTDRLHRSLGEPITLFLDRAPTSSSIFTATKTTYRNHYAEARARFGLPDAGGTADVLLWNTKGMVTETSVRNIAFFRSGRWVTPHDSTGCLSGVMRRWLLEQGLVVTDGQGWLSKDGVQEGELVLVFNAVEGCRIAVAHLGKV
ncbi:aminotransferase [Russula earlei]|uniref:Aminotransferase n=1 Tax=Russula earlei TaxID=71964 RepID=A0ACC0UP72_9AGAM|nr:aminotransferase [Russula earlei]